MPYVLQDLKQDTQTDVVFWFENGRYKVNYLLVKSSVSEKNFTAIGIFANVEKKLDYVKHEILVKEKLLNIAIH